MAYPTLYVCDFARAKYSAVSSIPDNSSLSAQNTVDGDPNSLWIPGDTSAQWLCVLPVARVVLGIAISNHNLKGALISVKCSYNNSWYDTAITDEMVDTDEDLLYRFACPVPAAGTVRIDLSDGQNGNIKVGCISVLGDYGYSAAGVLTQGGGFGIIEIGGADSGHVMYPLSVAGDAGISAVVSSGGFTQFQRMGGSTEMIVLPMGLMRASRDYEMSRLFNAYYPRTKGEFSNPGFSKGCWLTSDEYSTDAPTVRYCVGVPSAPLRYQVDAAGSRSSGELVLRTLARDALT